MNRFNRTASQSRADAIEARRREVTNTKNRRAVCQRHEVLNVIDRTEVAYRLNPSLRFLRAVNGT